MRTNYKAYKIKQNKFVTASYREELFQRLCLIRRQISMSQTGFLKDAKAHYMFNSIFTDDFVQILC